MRRAAGLGVAAWATIAAAAPPTVRYAPTPAWVLPPPSPTATAALPGAPARVIYADTQIHAGVTGADTFTAYRVRALAPAALAIGNLALAWNPATDQVTVHRLLIHRGDQVIDVLATQKFDVIQREANLEQAALDGVRTATLQASGLQVGDEIEFAATVHQDDPNLGGAAQGFAQLPAQTTLGAFRVRASWPSAHPLRWSATPDLAEPLVSDAGGQGSVTFQLADPATVVSPEGAPARYLIHRLFQFSAFPAWAAVSRQLWPLFDAAARPAAGSPVLAEAAAIAASTPDPARRAEAALRLVQERVRYVYVGLDRANYRPATVDETWARRFGDCKAKTALLMALLRALDIPAEPVLVASTGADGVDARLPTTQVFDHVLVRATIAGKRYWLDGTRAGDRSLALLPTPVSRWGLALRADGAPLEPIAPAPLRAPQSIVSLDIDATAGTAVPAKVKATQVLRGDEAFQLRTQLAALAPDDANRALAAYWNGSVDWATPDNTAWRVAPADDALVLTMTGAGKPGWDALDKGAHSLAIAGAGFSPPAEMKRPKEQDQAAPWAVEFPRYRCWATTIHLPPPVAGFAWTYSSKPVDRRFAGADYYRAAMLQGNVMRTIMSRRTVAPEISAAEAAAVDAALPQFDNAMSQVWEIARRDAPASQAPAAAAFLATPIDWSSPDAPCRGPTPRP